MEVKHVSPTGAVVYWNAGPTQRELLARRLLMVGMGKFVPPERTDASALRGALQDYCERHSTKGKAKLVQPHKQLSKHGFEVIDVERGEDVNDYSHHLSVRIRDGNVNVVRGQADSRELQADYLVHKATLTGASVGQVLVGVLAQLGGTALRPSGGVYWIPEDAIATWEGVVAAVQESASEGAANNVYMLRTLLDMTGIRAVKDAIVSEVSAASDQLIEEVRAGDLGDQALTRRQLIAASLHARVKQYETILGEALTTLHEAIRVAEEAAASAIASQEASSVYASIF